MADLTEAIESLGKVVGDKVTDKFEMGTVIRWLAAGRYSYAAIKTPVGWSTTARAGNPYVDRSLTFEGLTKILKRAEVTNIEVAVDWKPIGEQQDPAEVMPGLMYVGPYNRQALIDQAMQPNSAYPRYANPVSEQEEDEGYDYPGWSGESI